MTISPAHHAKYIVGSAITDEIAAARVYETVPKGLRIPSYDIYGNNGAYQVRLDRPFTAKDEAGNDSTVKYLTPKGQKVVVDVHPSIREQALDASVPLWIVEGVRKADAGVSAGQCCVAIPGANTGYALDQETGRRTLRSGFEQMALDGRKVYLCLDSDAWTTPEVYRSFRTLSRLLVEAGALLYRVRLDPDTTGAKTGLDDYLVRGGSMRVLERAARRYSGYFEYDDTGMGQRLVDLCYPVVRYVPLVGWYVYNKERGCWEHDFESGKVLPYRMVQQALAAAEEINDLDIPRIIEPKAAAAAKTKWHYYRQARHVREVISMATQVPTIRIDFTAFESDPEEINCANGVLNLRTLALTRHRPMQMFTDRVPVEYAPDAYHIETDQFLDYMFPNAAFRAAVLRLLGCAILGDNRENVFAVIHGPGGAGKGTFLDLITATLNGYAKYTDAETWIKNGRTNKFLQMHMLRAARLVHSEELPKRARVDESLLKNATGGDAVQARTHYAEPYEYVPRWTLLINTNERPRMDVNDSGMKRRYIEIPVPRSVPKAQRDPTKRLRLPRDPEARRYMLRLMAEGARDYLLGGLRPSPEMEAATEEAWREQEPLAGFIRDECQMGAGCRVGLTELKAAYGTWCAQTKTLMVRGEAYETSLKNLTGAVKEKTNGAWHWSGVRLTPGMPDEGSVESVENGAIPINPREEDSLSKEFMEKGPKMSLSTLPPADGSSLPIPADAPAYTLIRTAADADEALARLDKPTLSIDIETTGLSPRSDRVRLLSVSDGEHAYLFDLFALDHETRARVHTHVYAREVIGHNLQFEFGFLPPSKETTAWDTMLATQVLDAGLFTTKGHYGLSSVTERFCGFALSKEAQTSDWSGDLTADQLSYAASDVLHLEQIKQRQIGHLSAASLMPTAELEMRALLGISWLARTGVPFDLDAWMQLARENMEKQEAVLHDLIAYADINWASPVQVRGYFEREGVHLASTDESHLAVCGHAAATRLLEYRALAKSTGTYGENWRGYVDAGRIHAGWKQCFTATGRMSCAEPNLQNLPRDPRVRGCFRAGDGRVLVTADYAQVEARIAAAISGDPKLLSVFHGTEDVYAVVARQLTGNPTIQKGDPERQMAKSAVLGLMFGMGADRFVTYCRTSTPPITEAMADDADLHKMRFDFFRAYSRLREWQREQGADDVTETFTIHGRRRQDQKYYSEKLNAPVQGTAADGMKAALARLWEESGEHYDASPVLCVHDSLTVECAEERVDEVARWLETVMVEEMERMVGGGVPIKVDVSVGKEWR